VAPNTIPKTSSGKVQRGVIQQRLARLLQKGAGAGAPPGRDLLLSTPGASEAGSS